MDKNYTVKNLRIKGFDYPYLDSNEQYKGKVLEGGTIVGKTAYGVIVSFKGKPLGYFSVGALNIIMCWDGYGPDGKMTGGCKEISEGDINLSIPFFPTGKYADIFDSDGKKVLTIDLMSKTTCNENGKCDRPLEDRINCPSDCHNNEPIIDDYFNNTDSSQKQTVDPDPFNKKRGIEDKHENENIDCTGIKLHDLDIQCEVGSAAYISISSEDGKEKPKTYQLKAIATFICTKSNDSTTTVEKDVTHSASWHTNDQTIAKVINGNVLGIARGRTYLKATYGETKPMSKSIDVYIDSCPDEDQCP